MKRLFASMMCIIFLIGNVGFALDTSQWNYREIGPSKSGEITFEASKIQDYTQRIYSTVNFRTTVETGYGNRYVGDFFKEYNYGDDGNSAGFSSSEFESMYSKEGGSWSVFGGLTARGIIEDISFDDPEDKEAILKEMCESGAVIYFDPRFEVAVSEDAIGRNSAIKTITRTTVNGNSKKFYVIATDLTADEAIANYNWSSATAASFRKQFYKFTAPQCNHDRYCKHGPDYKTDHESLINSGYIVKTSTVEKTCDVYNVKYEKMVCEEEKPKGPDPKGPDPSSDPSSGSCTCQYVCQTCGAPRNSSGSYTHKEFYVESTYVIIPACDYCKQDKVVTTTEEVTEEVEEYVPTTESENKIAEVEENRRKIANSNVNQKFKENYDKLCDDAIEEIKSENTVTRTVTKTVPKSKTVPGIQTISVPTCREHTHIGTPVCNNHIYIAVGDMIDSYWIHTGCYNDITRDLLFERRGTNHKLFSIGDIFSLYRESVKFTHIDEFKKFEEHERICANTKQVRCTYKDPNTGNQCPKIIYGTQCCKVDPSGKIFKFQVETDTQKSNFENGSYWTFIGMVLEEKPTNTFTIKDFIEKSLTKADLPEAYAVCHNVTNPDYWNLSTEEHGITIDHCPPPVIPDITITFPVNVVGDDPVNPNPTPLPNGDPNNPTNDDDPKDPPTNDDNPDVDVNKVGQNGLFVLSVRDLRWMPYMNEKFAVPSGDNMIADVDDKDVNEVKMGYAVECLFRARNFEENKVNIGINPSVVGYPGIKGTVAELKKTGYTTTTGVPVTEWTWLYYIPFDTVINNSGNPVTVKFDIKLSDTDSGKLIFRYLDYVKNGWKGKVFQYSTEHNLLEDIYDNATN